MLELLRAYHHADSVLEALAARIAEGHPDSASALLERELGALLSDGQPSLRAELLGARALRARGQATEAREAARRAATALANGYGPENQWTRAAQLLVDSLGSK